MAAMARPRPSVVLTIAGSDPSGGAGIQADLKTFHAFGCYGEAVLTALTAQNTRGVSGVHAVPVPFVVRQIEAVLEDIPPDAAKTGMLATRELVEAVAATLGAARMTRLVVDPVMVATSGDRLLDGDAVRAVRDRLLPLAAVVTPNLPEAEVLTGVRVDGEAAALEAGRRLLALGARAALVKGGHGKGPRVLDLLVEEGRVTRILHPRLRTRSTHGTGCTLSAALAAGLARGRSLRTAASEAADYVHRALARAPRLGSGHGPVNHLVPARPGGRTR
jgi:hydroxymethylpyrimidine/phosphomethylpyrimidine kinase